MFVKYQHLERIGTDATDGIQLGTSYVFPKLDGTNAQLWFAEGEICGGSRNRELAVENDNAGFYNWAKEQENLVAMVADHPDKNFYGEWLVPHSLKTYREDAWRKLYLFDVWCRRTERWLTYDEQKYIYDAYGVDYLAPISIHKNASLEDYLKTLDKNVFLIQDGQGVGEGVVIKNYEWTNRWNQAVWAKLITSAFKEVHHKEMGAPVIGGELIEEKIVRDYVNEHLVNKVHSKIVNEMGEWSSKFIPRLLSEVYYDLVTEETWNILKAYKQPRIDFKVLQMMTIKKIKDVKPSLF